MDFVDLEQIHQSLPQLKHFTLKDLTCYPPQSNAQDLDIQPASQLASFQFQIRSLGPPPQPNNGRVDNEDNLFDDEMVPIPMGTWSSYTRLKYNHIDKIDISTRSLGGINNDHEIIITGRVTT